MKKKYYYMCKKCWYSWSSERIYRKCVKCRSVDIDVQDDLILSE